MNEAENLALVRRYLKAIEDQVSADELREFFTEDVVQSELPNRLVPQGAVRDRAALLAGAERGRTVVRDQRYEVLGAVAQGDAIALEVAWSAILEIPIGTLAPGDTMRATIGMFLTIRDGRICSQRNYDCYEPF